jgi:glycosyltransferase involved in cell wall biosynthesis
VRVDAPREGNREVRRGHTVKVCFLTSVHPLFDVRIFHKEARSLVEAGYDVTLVAQHHTEEIVGGIRIVPVAKPRNRFERMTRTVRAVFRKALLIDADIYHLHDPELLLVSWLLRLRGKCVVYDMHENVPKQILDKKWINPLLRNLVARLVRIVERLLLLNIPVIFAETSYREDYPWVKTHTTILNMPLVNQLRALGRHSQESGDFAVGYMGGVSEARGALIILEALKVLKVRGLQPRWECVGGIDEPFRQHLVMLTEQFGLRRITFHGRLPAHKGWSIMAKCRVGLAVLQPIPNYTTSYPQKIFEYMALGLPVVVSDFPLYKEVVEGAGCGMAVSPVEAGAIADAVASLLGDPEASKEMGRRGRRAVEEKYNWGVEEKRLLEFYGNVLDPPRCGGSF